MAALTGLLMMGGYSIFYLLALERGIAPGVLATILGVQPIVTLAIVERRWQPMRVAGLGLSLAGLALVVCRGVGDAGMPLTGVACALAALVALTVGALLQNARARRPPTCCRCRTRSASRYASRSCRSSACRSSRAGHSSYRCCGWAS
jgi:drug/metabolite transporter (DMT)-like permease